MRILLPFYLLAFVAANLIVKHYGATGLWVSSFFLIPFDFIARCVIHERYKGIKLFAILTTLTVLAAIITILININALSIALASVAGFTVAQIVAGVFYQTQIKKSYFWKVNGSDFFAIVFDSIVFQFIAFLTIDPWITGGQIVIKFLGGLMWYYIIFKLLKLERHFNRR